MSMLYVIHICSSNVLVLILKANLPKVRLPMHNVKAITDYRMSKITCIKFSAIIENSPSGLQLKTFLIEVPEMT